MTGDSRRSLEALIAKWRTSMEPNHNRYICADELEAALQAVEEPPTPLAHKISHQQPDGTVVLTVEKEKEDLPRVDKGVGSRPTGSTASTHEVK